jgi:hypothetical protein
MLTKSAGTAIKRRVLGIYGALLCHFGGGTRPKGERKPSEGRIRAQLCLKGRTETPAQKESRPERRLSL